MDKEYKRGLLRKFSPCTEVDEFSDENDAFDAIVLGLYLSSRTRSKPEVLTVQQLEKFSEQMDEMSEKCGKRPIEEVREMYRNHIRRSLIGLNNLYQYESAKQNNNEL